MSTKQWTLWNRYDEICQRTGKTPILQSAAYERAATRDDGMMEFILSMPGIKRDGFDIVQSGWILDDYRENSVVLWRHSDKLPTDIMGNSPKVWRSSAGGMPLHLRGLLSWATEEQNPSIKPIRALYEDHVLRAVSVRWEDDGRDSIEEITPEELKAAKVDPFIEAYVGGIRFLRARLVEWSLVPLGMDKQALSVRCQRGDLGDISRFVATVTDEQLMTEDGREVLLLDGHPARFVTERGLMVDMGAGQAEAEQPADEEHFVPFEDATACVRAAQKLFRAGEMTDEVRAFIRSECARLGIGSVVDGPLARTYEALHATLRDGGEGAEVLHPTISDVGQKLFGDVKLREAWEARALPEPASVWAAVSSLLEAELRGVVESEEDRDAHIDSLIGQLDAVLGESLRQHEGCAAAVNAAVEAAIQRMGNAPEPQRAAEDPEPAVVEPEPAPDEASIARLANLLESRTARKGKGKGKSLLDSLLALAPATDKAAL